MGNRVIGGWKKAVVYDPATGDLVQLNTLSTEFSAFDPEHLKNETPTGQAFGGHNIPLVIGFLDSDGIVQFEEWKGKTPLSAVVFVPGGQHILFYETEEFFFSLGAGVDARNGAAVHQIDTTAHGENPDVLQYKNLAKAITFVGDVGSLIFPLQGPELVVAADYVNINAPTLSITAHDFDGIVKASSSQVVDAPGRVSAKITLPANTFKVTIDLTGSGDADVSNVSLRSDNETEYLTY